jgi:3-oxoacyl-[acyl-carrier protein] reductase
LTAVDKKEFRMDLKLKGKIALVTGTASQIGYGKEIALTLAREGCDVISADLNMAGAQQTADAIASLGVRSMAVKIDVTNRPEVDQATQSIIDHWGHIDILVNNAGASAREKPFMQMTQADWDIDINTNLRGQMNVAQSVIPYMLQRKYGRIINTSGGQGIPTISVYGAAKAGVEAFTHALALELASSGIVVNGVAPGLGQTNLVVRNDPQFLEANRQRSALKRLCTPQDVAPVVAFLASDVCSYMVGQFIRLNTG